MTNLLDLILLVKAGLENSIYIPEDARYSDGAAKITTRIVDRESGNTYKVTIEVLHEELFPSSKITHRNKEKDSN